MQFYIAVENQILLESDSIKDSIIDLISVYFTFDIAYPKLLYPVAMFDFIAPCVRYCRQTAYSKQCHDHHLAFFFRQVLAKLWFYIITLSIVSSLVAKKDYHMSGPIT